METGRIVTNEKGEKAWWDGKNLSPVRIEPGTTGLPEGQNLTITDEKPRGRVVTNEQGHRAWWDGTNLKPLAVGQSEQMEADVSKSKETGASLMGTPPPTKVEPMQEPLFMEKYGLPKPPLKGLQEQIGLPLAEFAIGASPMGRGVKAVAGAAGSAGQDIMAGKTPSLLGMGIGAVSGLVGEGVVQGGKWALRTAAKAFGKEPLKAGAKASARQVLSRAPSVEQASEGFEAVKGIKKGVEIEGPTAFEDVAKDILRRGEREGIETSVLKKVEREIVDVTNARLQGKPLNYGEVFKRARDINQQAGKAATTEGKISLYKLHDAYIDDLSKIGPEAREAVDAYRLAKRSEAVVNAVGSGSKTTLAKALAKSGEIFSPEEVKNLEAIRRHLGPNWNATLTRVGTVAGLGGYLTSIPGLGPVSSAGLIMSALVRLPKGVGESIARSLVSPEGEISKNVAPAVGMAVRSYIQGRRNENINGNN